MTISLFFPIFIGKSFYRPRYGQARELLTRSLRSHGKEGVGELLCHAAKEARARGGEIDCLPNVLPAIEELKRL